MRILVLGGTIFLSAAIAADAVSRGHEVVCLARAASSSTPPGTRLIRADRETGDSAYREATGSWDAVVDVSWQPLQVQTALNALAASARHWTYVSSCSVYADQNTAGVDETAATLPPLPSAEEAGLDTYGEAKVACEDACRLAIGPRLHISRPGLIGGPGDPSDRFGYWPARFARHGEDAVLAPHAEATWTQTIDVRDLASWLVRAAEDGVTGSFNAVGESVSLDHVLALARQATGHQGEVVSVPSAWLLERGVQPWSGPDSFPLWLPQGSGYDGFARRRGTAAQLAGLRNRPLTDTIAATLDCERRAGLSRPRQAGLSPEKESALLLEWAGRQLS
jgi:nucleoside-diphosphate-sugar epimerase